MIRMRVSIDNTLDDRLRIFGNDAPKILRKILRTTGNEFRKHQRNNYLRGQMLGRRTGETYRATKVKKVRRKMAYSVIASPLANIYEHPGGATIKPKSARVLRWYNQQGEPQFAREVHLRARPFVTASFDSFGWDREGDRAAEKVIRKELARRFGSG